MLEIWSEKLQRSGGPFLFGAFSIADAMYFPVLGRFRTYGVELPASLAPYGQALEAHPAVRALIEVARTAPRIPGLRRRAAAARRRARRGIAEALTASTRRSMNKTMPPRDRLVAALAIVFAIEWAVLAISPNDRAAWALENVLVVVAVVALAASYRQLRFSWLSYLLIFVFLFIHEIGAYYTYSEVPYNDWFAAVTGRTLNELLGWERNHFDRAVHFLYGLLLAYPIREIFFRVAAVRGFWSYFLPLDLTASTSMLFELFEWIAAEIAGGDLGPAYLGTQGDVWDAHKDMALATTGALIAMLATAAVNYSFQRDFAREWTESLRVKRVEPPEQSLGRRPKKK